MKGIDIFCASQAATAICLSMDEGLSSSSSSASILLGSSGRAIDRYNPIIKDPRRIIKPLIPPCSSQLPITPKPHNHQNKHIKNSSKAKSEPKKKSSTKPNVDQKRKSSAKTNDNVVSRKSWSCTRPGEFITPPGSSRYLLSDKPFLDAISDLDQVLKLVPVEANKSLALKTDESYAIKPPSSSRSQNQVVVLRVSLHCKGCERKMRKHLSRMEGVTSFNIDFAAKKVTVAGDVTPLQVLASISKVKNAQLWMPSISSASAPPANLNNSEIKKLKEADA